MDSVLRVRNAPSRCIRRITLFALAAIVIGATWSYLSYSSDLVAQYVLPRPTTVLVALGQLLAAGTLAQHIAASLSRVFLGFLLAGLTAIPLGIALGWSRTLYLLFEPGIELLRPISPIAWIPLSILWFGLGEESKVFLVWLISFFFVLVNTVSGVRGVDRQLVQAAQTLGASDLFVFREVVLPAALPAIITGLRISLGVALGVVVIAEMIGARSGIGYMMARGRAVLDPSQVVVGMAVLGVLGYLLNQLLPALERRFTNYGKGVQE